MIAKQKKFNEREGENAIVAIFDQNFHIDVCVAIENDECPGEYELFTAQEYCDGSIPDWYCGDEGLLFQGRVLNGYAFKVVGYVEDVDAWAERNK